MLIYEAFRTRLTRLPKNVFAASVSFLCNCSKYTTIALQGISELNNASITVTLLLILNTSLNFSFALHLLARNYKNLLVQCDKPFQYYLRHLPNANSFRLVQTQQLHDRSDKQASTRRAQIPQGFLLHATNDIWPLRNRKPYKPEGNLLFRSSLFRRETPE